MCGVRGNNDIAVAKFHPPHTAGAAAHRTYIALGEADRGAVARHDEHVVGTRGVEHTHQLVPVTEVDGDQAVGARLVVVGQRGLLHHPVARDEHQVPVVGELTGVDHRFDLFVRVELQKVDDSSAPRRSVHQGDLVGLQPVDLALVCEEEQVRVGARGEHPHEQIVVFEAGTLHTAATAALSTEDIGRDGLHVAALTEGDHDVLVVDEVLHLHVAGIEGDLAATR